MRLAFDHWGREGRPLVVLELCREYGDLVERLVPKEPPGSKSVDFEEISRGVETDAARAREAPEAHKREQLQENPSWSEGDAQANVESLRDCDAGPVAAMIRNDLRFDLSSLVGSVRVPTLLILGSAARGSALPEPERTAVANSLRLGTIEVFDAGHGVHREQFEGYIRFLNYWLEGNKA